MTDTLRTRIAAVLSDHDPEGAALSDYHYDVADAVIAELPELRYAHVPQRIMLSHASEADEERRLDAASWLEKELAAAGLKCGAGWVLYNLVDGVVARLNGVAE